MFVDSNVFMYAVGRPHPLKRQAREFFSLSGLNGVALFTSAEVLQELMHAYLPVGRVDFLEAAMALVVRHKVTVWPLRQADVVLAKELHRQYPTLSARDLCYLASCIRRGVSEIKTFDRALQAVADDALRRSR